MHRNMIAIGGSAGSLDLLRSIVSTLPGDFEGNVFIVVHIGHRRSRLPELLANCGKLPVSFPQDCEPIARGRIYVAPSDRHLLVAPGVVRISRGPREHFTRPAIDPLFRSLAAAYGERVIGVVLSGGGSDGAAGLDTIKRKGGLAIVLDPRDALATEMPRAAVEILKPDYIVTAVELPSLLVRLEREAAPAEHLEPPRKSEEAVQPMERPLAVTCPECGGALRPLASALSQYRCHIGHTFGARELLPAQLELREKALDVAQRVLNERLELSRRIVERSKIAGRKHGLLYWEGVRADAEKQADAIRRALHGASEVELQWQEASE
jgi:two-component system chemotaxis response regulator CheB